MSSAERLGVTPGLEPTYIGYLATKEDALVLIKAYLSGILSIFRPGLRRDELPTLIRSGSTFMYEHSASGIKDWNDGVRWSPMCHDDGFWVSCQTNNVNGLWKARLSIPFDGAFYHFVCYFKPWETVDGTLKTPTRDPKLRTIVGTVLASQLTTPSMFCMEQLSFHSELAAVSSNLHLIFTRHAQFLCLRLVSSQDRECCLTWSKQRWFPILRTDEKYWFDLASQPIFLNMKIKDLARQMRSLLSILLRISSSRPLPRISGHGQISDRFSPLQNRTLICEAFRVPVNYSKSCATADWTEFGRAISLSELSRKPIALETMQEWWTKLSLYLSLDAPLNYLNLSPSLHKVSQHLSVKDGTAVHFAIAFYQRLFPSFRNAQNHDSLFFVICYTTCTDEQATKMLHDWVQSEEYSPTYHQLLASLLGPLPFHELVLSLATLLLIYGIGQEFQPTKSTSRASLADLDRFLHGHFAIGETHSFLSTMLWTFMWKLTSEPPSPASTALVRLLDTIAVIPSALPQIAHKVPASYWAIRGWSQISHDVAMAHFRGKVEPVYSSTGDVELIEENGDGRTGWKEWLCLSGMNACVPQSAKAWFAKVRKPFEGVRVTWWRRGEVSEPRPWVPLD
ncbi:hypothetical protein MMC17_009145 [Xylographa soralifera]|nr:hypothetical protein [Xylographa soralifera]